MSDRKPIFDAIKRARSGAAFTEEAVRQIDELLDMLGVPRPNASRKIGPKGIALIKRWEGCKLTAYPDPGTGGKPWTIGWGSTTDDAGKPIQPGTVWTQERADKRLESHVAEFAAGVDKAIGGAPTTPEQFDAMVSLAYNVGLGAFAGSTLLKKHKAGDYAGAAKEFARWNRAGGRVMAGLSNRRADEGQLYRSNTPK